MKFHRIALIGLLVLSLTACTRQGSGPSSSTTPEAEQPSTTQDRSEAPSQPASSEESSWNSDDELPVFSASDDKVEIRIEMDKPQYDKNSVIHTTVSITNLTDKSMVYVQGSSASVIPDALIYRLEDLAALFYPEFVTMDYGVQILEPGLTLRYSLDFVPYTANDGTTAFGTDKELGDFQTIEFTPAAPSEIKGSASFTYVLLPDNSDTDNTLLALEESPSQVLELEFTTTIVE